MTNLVLLQEECLSTLLHQFVRRKAVKAFKSVMVFLISCQFFLANPLAAAGEEFYSGKTLRFIVGFSPGGGYDVYTRTIARHISKHLPGKPTTVVENMPGRAALLRQITFTLGQTLTALPSVILSGLSFYNRYWVIKQPPLTVGNSAGLECQLQITQCVSLTIPAASQT